MAKLMNLKGIFVYLKDGKHYETNETQNIPEKIDALIKFVPDYPPSPHSEEDHEYIESFMDVFREIQKREKY